MDDCVRRKILQISDVTRFHFGLLSYPFDIMVAIHYGYLLCLSFKKKKCGNLSKQEMMLDIKTFLEAMRDGNVGVAKFMATSLAIKFKKVAEDNGDMSDL